MAITKNGSGQIVYTETAQPWSADRTGVHADNEFAVSDKINPLKQVQFNVNPLTPTPGTLTLQVDVGADQTLNLTDLSSTDSFSTIQPDAGTSPVADGPADTLTLTSSDASLTITGNATTDTINYVVNTTNLAKLNTSNVFASTISASNLSGTNTGDVTLGAVGSSSNSNGASLSSQVLTLQPANGSNPGVVTSGSQTIGGAKTFSAAISASNLSGTNTGDQTISLTSDVTGSGTGSFAATIANSAVTNAKMANMADQTIKGNNSGGSSAPLDLTTAQVKTMLSLVGTNSGDVTLAAFGSTPGSNGASLSGQVLTLQPADATNSGGVSTGTQTLAGAKTFTGNTLIANNAASIATVGGSSSTAKHVINGGFTLTTRTITGNLTVDTTTSDYLIYVTTSSGAISITLPTPVNGRILLIKDISGQAATNNITLVRNGSEKIEGLAANKILQTNWGSWTFSTNGTDWFMH